MRIIQDPTSQVEGVVGRNLPLLSAPTGTLGLQQ